MIRLKSAIPIAFILALFVGMTSFLESNSRQQQTDSGQQRISRPRVDYNELFGVDSTYGYRYFDEMVPGGDTCRLLTRIYLPEGEGPWPVVVTRTPYVYTGPGDNLSIGREYAARGIGYIQQDCRGKGGSEGFYQPNIYERADGIALYKWIASQSWCESIGIFGSSYTALTGWLVADNIPDKVKGLYLIHYSVDRHVSLYSAGLFRQDILSGWTIDNAEEDIKKPERLPDQKPGEAYYEFYRHMPHIEADIDVLGARLSYYRDWITHTDHSDPYWNEGVWADLKNVPPKIKVPVTIVAGQFDHHEEGTILGYELLDPETKKRSRLILGSWNHSYQVTPTHVLTGNAGQFNSQSDQFRWFYALLVDNIVPAAEIRVYVIEEDRWINVDEWPIIADRKVKMHMTSEKNSDSDSYILSGREQISKDEIHYIYDPLDPVMAVGGETMFTSSANRGSQLQPPPGYRPDVVSFVSAPLKEDMAVAGKVTVTLNVSTDVDDTSFAFTLSEVTPDGATYNMRTAITTLAYRNAPLGTRQNYTSGEIVEINIESVPIIWNVKAGNSIRIDIKSSNFPEYSIHSNYAGIWSLQPKTRIANQTLYVGGGYNTSITFPVIYLD